MDNITVRTAKLSDAEIIAANNLAMARETEGRSLDADTLRAGVRRVLEDHDRGVYYLAQRNGRVVGQLLITREWSDWRDGWFWWIQSVYVLPQARGTGVYRALHEHVDRQARQTPHVCGLRLYVDRENTAARRVYERLGMRPTNYEFLETAWSPNAPTARPEDLPPAESREPIDKDLYCLHCGYNLRGLSGDPVRCPECGKLNTSADLDCPPKMVERRARRMETAAALCFLSVTGFLGSLVFSLLSGEYGCFWCASIVAPLPWAIGSTEFKNGCLAETGWMRVLLRNHAYLTVMLCIALTTWALGSAAVWGIDSLVHHGSTLTWRHCLWGAGLALVALLWTRALTSFNRPREAAIDRLARAAVHYEVRATRQ